MSDSDDLFRPVVWRTHSKKSDDENLAKLLERQRQLQEEKRAIEAAWIKTDAEVQAVANEVKKKSKKAASNKQKRKKRKSTASLLSSGSKNAATKKQNSTASSSSSSSPDRISDADLAQLRQADVKQLIETWGYDNEYGHTNYEAETHNFKSDNGRILQNYTDPIFRILLNINRGHVEVFVSDARVFTTRSRLRAPDSEINTLIQRFFQEKNVWATLARVKRICEASTYPKLHVISDAISKLYDVQRGDYDSAFEGSTSV